MVVANPHRNGTVADLCLAGGAASVSLGLAALWLACLGGLALVLAPPLLAAAGWPYAEVLRWLLHSICHQIPERSFHLLGEPLAVCQRCTGLYLGFALGVVAWPMLPRLAARLAAQPRYVGFFALPMALDWLVENSAASRFATGMIAAFPIGLLALLALDSTDPPTLHDGVTQ